MRRVLTLQDSDEWCTVFWRRLPVYRWRHRASCWPYYLCHGQYTSVWQSSPLYFLNIAKYTVQRKNTRRRKPGIHYGWSCEFVARKKIQYISTYVIDVRFNFYTETVPINKKCKNVTKINTSQTDIPLKVHTYIPVKYCNRNHSCTKVAAIKCFTALFHWFGICWSRWNLNGVYIDKRLLW